MYHTEIDKNGMIRIPKDYADYIGLSIGDKVVFSIINKETILIKKGHIENSQKVRKNE